MDPVITIAKAQICEQQEANWDLKRVFANIIDTKNDDYIVSYNEVLEQYKAKNFKWNYFNIKKQSIRRMSFSRIRQCPLYYSIIQKLDIVDSSYLIRAIKLINSELNADFFTKLRKLRFQIKELLLVSCQMKSDLQSCLKELDLRNLYNIHLQSINMTNLDMKQLMKLKLNNIELITLVNVNITSDSIRLYNKIYKKYVNINVFFQRDFHLHSSFKNSVQIAQREYMFQTFYNNDNVIYFPHLAKLCYDIDYQLTITLACDEISTVYFYRQYFLICPKTYLILKRCINIKDSMLD